MNIKDSLSVFDKENVYGSVEELSKQVSDAYNQTLKISIPDEYSDVDNIVMCGMGGSGLGARVIESLYVRNIKVPLVRVNDYNLPGFVNERSLVFCSSYSGETEETLENVKQAISKKAKWIAIGKGGTLIDLAKSNNAPYYMIDPKYNPSNQPRMAVGYSIIGQLILASKTGIINFQEEEMGFGIKAMEDVINENSLDVSEDMNEAIKLSEKIQNKVVLFVASEHLIGAMHVVNNQFNENAKNLTADYFIPELNHHLMEGLKNPKENKNNIFVIFFDSNLYSKRIQQRMSITKDVVSQNGIQNYTYIAKSKTPFSQVFETIQFGSYSNFYLTMRYGQDPAPIPWVDYFKNKLGQPLGK